MSERADFTHRTCSDVARELLSQPGLFLEFDGIDGFTPPPQAVARYTADRQEEQQMLKVGAMRLLGASDRQIEQACHVTRRSIPPILAALEKAGRITPLKERLAMVCGDNAERASIVLRMLLEKVEQGLQQPEVEDEEEDDPALVYALIDGEPLKLPQKKKQPKLVTMEMAAMIKAVSTAAGITIEKTLLLTGQATEIVETRVGAGRQEFDRWWRETVTPIQATVTPVDLESPASTAAVQQTSSPATPGHAADTSAPINQAPPLLAPNLEPPTTDQGGGGSAGGQGPSTPDG